MSRHRKNDWRKRGYPEGVAAATPEGRPESNPFRRPYLGGIALYDLNRGTSRTYASPEELAAAEASR